MKGKTAQVAVVMALVLLWLPAAGLVALQYVGGLVPPLWNSAFRRIEVNANASEINVEQDSAQPDGILAHYRKLVALRRERDIVAFGETESFLANSPSVMAYQRRLGAQRLVVLGNFTTTLGCHWEIPDPSSSMASVSRLTTSTDMGPSTISAISRTASLYPLEVPIPSFEASEGLVVTPLTTPSLVAWRISSTLAVSRKMRIGGY